MTKRRKTQKGKQGKIPAFKLKEEIIRLFKRHPKKRFNARQIVKKLKIKNSKDSVQSALEKLAEKDVIAPIDKYDKFKLNKKTSKEASKVVEGVVQMIRSGAAYVVCEDLPDDDIYVHEKHLNTALNGDTVKVTYRKPEGRRRAEGEVLEIIERATEHFIGLIELSPKYGMVTSSTNENFQIYIPLENVRKAKNGEKVVVRITKWASKTQKYPIGKVTEVLGRPGSNDSEMKAILINSGFELSFPEEVMAYTNQLPDHILESDLEGRRDFRDVLTITIDPLTAKDFDDALSFRYTENGHCEIGIHIADVTHYVKEGSALDKEALKRSTSVYLVDRVLPMLPEKLSNQLCSLRPNEDSLCFSAIFTFNKDFKIIAEWFGKTIIHSDRRFTYEEAQEVIETGEGDYVTELKVLNKVAHKLRKERYKKGSISFDAPEVKFKLDENAEPIELYVKERKDAHLLVEDFMLLANKRVAAKIGKRKEGTAVVPFVYRVHDLPNPDKVAEFAKFARALGYNMRVDTPEHIAASYNEITSKAKDNPDLRMLEPLAIRTMSKAIYTTDNIGHYGLGFDYYTHFTSPIRRYSDVLVHRVLEKNLTTTTRVDKEKLEIQCKHISSQERKAMDAERQSVKYKQVEYMSKHIGEVFEGHISGFMERGMFVEMKQTMCEGVVLFESMFDDFVLSESRLSIQGRTTKFTFKIGDTVNVKIIHTNLNKRQITLELME